MDLNTLQVWIHVFVNNEHKVMLDDFENLTIGTLWLSYNMLFFVMDDVNLGLWVSP